MKIIFMGTPEFAVKTLEKCIEHHDVIGVFTQPDKPKGRGNKLTPSEVKVVALNHDIPVYQPEKIRKDTWPDQIRAMKPDVIVVVAYGQILSQEILDIPQYGCINVHASLLPKYRGAAPINWAIANGETVSGVTTMQMDKGLDTGDMLLTCEVPIDNQMTAQELHDILASEGAALLTETLRKIEDGTIVKTKQDDASSCYASMLSKESSRIDWNLSAVEIHNRVRGFNPWPIAHTTYDQQMLKIYRSTPFVVDDLSFNFNAEEFTAGCVVFIDKSGIYVLTGKGILRIDELQLGSNKRMLSQAFLLGNTISIGTKLL